jgi:hypothetical protein
LLGWNKLLLRDNTTKTMTPRLTAIFVIILFALRIQAQEAVLQDRGETIAISGRVVDASTGAALPFAAISVSRSTLGTVTNDDGQFWLIIPSSMRDDTLLAAYLGFETYRRRIGELNMAAAGIRLLPRTFDLSEVEVVGLTPEEVIRRAVAAIPANCGTDSLILTAFVRTAKVVNSRLAEFTEAIIEDLKTGYSLCKPGDMNRRREASNIPLLLKGRVVSDTMLVNALGDAGREAGCLGCNFVHDIAEFYHHTILDEKFFRHYQFRMVEITNPAGGKIFRIRFDQKPGVKEKLWKGELYIASPGYAILKVTQKPSFNAWETFEKNKFERVYTLKNRYGWIADIPLIDRTVTYAERDGRWYLSTIRDEEWITFTLPATGQKLRFSYKNEVVVTDVTRDPARLRNFTGDQSTGVGQRWDQVAGKPDPDFWKGFNYLPVEEALQSKVAGIREGVIE